MKKSKKKTKGFPLRFYDEKIKEEMEKIAEENNRSLNAQINVVLKEYVRHDY